VLTREIMTQPPAIVHQDTPLSEVVELMLSRRLEGVAVVDEQGGLCGLITDEVFTPEGRAVPFSTERLPQLFGEWMPKHGVEKMYATARRLKAKDVMRTWPCVIAEEAPVEEALLKMQSARCLVVVRGNVPVGILSHHDVLSMMR